MLTRETPCSSTGKHRWTKKNLPRFHCVFLALQMFALSGVEVGTALRCNKNSLEICYLHLTLLTRPHQIKKAREATSFLFFSFLFIFQTATRVGEVEKGYSCDA